MTTLEWSQYFSHYKSKRIFPNGQGQLTPQSKVWSGRISNPSEILWLSLLPARMKNIHSKMKALEWSQDYLLIFKRSRAANSEVSNRIAKIQTHPSFYRRACYLQEFRRSIQNWLH